MKATGLLMLLSLLDCSAGCDMGAPVEIDPCATAGGSTSHDFMWGVDTLGDGNSSVLNDVFIVNDTSVWAVGEIYLKDSTAQIAYPGYNAAMWNGVKWNLVRILVRDYGQITGYFPLKAVFAFGVNDVWFASDADLIQWNGSTFVNKAFFMTSIPFDGQVQKIWGVNSSSIYCVGRSGAIYFYNGSSWFKVASGTTTDIQDIWGGLNPQTGELEVLAVASMQNTGRALDLLKIRPSPVEKLDTTGLHVNQRSIWFIPGGSYYVAGNGVYHARRLTEPQWTVDNTQPLLYKERIRGTSCNDFMVVGDFGLVSHYNGSTWKHYAGNELPNTTGIYYGVSLSQRLAVAVGYVGGRAVAIIGKRS